ncbi:ABC transporter permease [Candidatus Hodarchaeum mangrovi]
MAKTIKNIIRAIKANKLRFLTISFVIAIGVSSWNMMIMAFLDMDFTYKQAFRQYNMASFTIQTANPGGSGSDAWIDFDNLTSYLDEFKQSIAVVESYELRVVYDTKFIIRGNSQNGRLIAYKTTDTEGNLRLQPDVNGIEILEGREFTLASQYQNVCYVEGHLGEYWKLKENDFIGLGDQNIPFQVLGIVASPEYLMNMGSYADLLPSPRRFGVIFLPLRVAQSILNVQGKVNEISVKLDWSLSQKERKDIANQLKTFLEDEKGLKLGEPVDLDEQVAYWLLRMDIQEARELGYVLPIILLGMAMWGLYVLLGRMVVAERKDIGVAQALGYSRKTIILQYVGIALLISIIGTVIGTLLGVIIASQFSPAYAKTVTVLFPVYTRMDPIVIGAGFILGIITGLFGGYLPVRNAIQPLPAESLRFDPSLHITSGQIPLLERILKRFRIKLRTTGFKLPLRNFFRSKKRTFSSIIGVIISVSLISCMFAMFESMNIALSIQYQDIEDWDLRVDFSEVPTNSSKIVSAIKQIDGVTAGTYSLTSGATIFSNFSSNTKTIQLIGLKDSDGYLGHAFEFKSGTYDPEGIILSVPVAEKLKVKVDDIVSLEIPKLTKLVSTAPLRAHFEMVNVSFQISGIIDEFNGLVSYLGLDKLKIVSNFPGDPANSILLKVENPTIEKLNEIRSTIKEKYNYNVRNIFTKEEQTSDLLVLMNAMYYIVYAIVGFAMALAIIMVYNTVYINLQEQQREIATLLTIGTPNRRIIRNVTIENLIVTVIGSVLGLIFGWVLLWFMMDVVLEMEFFRIPLFMSNSTILQSFFFTLIAVLIAEYFPLRRILNLNLAEATKERVV